MNAFSCVPLREIVRVHYGKALKAADRDVIGPHNVYGSSGCVGKHRTRLVEYPTLIVGRKGSVGQVTYAPDGGWPIDTTFFVEILDEHQVYLRFLFYALRRARLDRHTITTTIPGLNRDDIYKTKILLPPLAEQCRIAAILDKADAIRRKRRESIKLLDEFLRSAFLEMFGDPVRNPRGWEVRCLRDVVKEDQPITYGIVQAGPHVNGGVPYIKSGDLRYGEISMQQLSRTSHEIARRYERSMVHAGDIVFSIRASVGAAAVVPESLDGANLTQGTARISPGSIVDGEYLLAAIRSQGFQHWIRQRMKGATFREITLAALREAPVMVPPIKSQKQYARIVAGVGSIKSHVTAATSTTSDLFDSLAQRAFRGEL